MPYRKLRPFRRLEWNLARATVVWGVWLVIFPASADPVMDAFLPAQVWGVLGYLLGLFHLWALYINGSRLWSPHVRVTATVAAACLFGAASASSAAALWMGVVGPSLVVPLHFALTGMALSAARIAGWDSYYAYHGKTGLPHGT